MSSFGRAFSQVTSNFVVKVTENYQFGDMFLQSDFDAWYALNSSAITKVSNSIYLVNDPTQFSNVVKQLDHALGSNYLQDYNNHSAIDMGKEISIGIPTDPRLIVFRRVKLPSNDSNFGSGQAGFVVTENNVANLTRPRFLLAVARV
jgi:hypothetical protein